MNSLWAMFNTLLNCPAAASRLDHGMAKNPALTLARYKQLVTRLEKSLARGNQKLLQLPAKYGFRSVKDLIAALKVAEKQDPASSSARAKSMPGKRTRGRKRAKITVQTKALVQSLAKEGKTGIVIARKVGISVPSVANIKRELGLTRTKKAQAK